MLLNPFLQQFTSHRGVGQTSIHILSDIWGRLSALPKMGNKGSGKETLIWNNLAAAYQIRSFPPFLESAARKWNGKSPSIATNNSAMMTKFGGILGQIWMSVVWMRPQLFWKSLLLRHLSLWWTTESKLKLFSLIWASIPSPNGAHLYDVQCVFGFWTTSSLSQLDT